MAFYRFANPEIKNLFQWNKNIKLFFPTYEPGQEIHFSNNKETAYVVTLDENLQAQIPNEFFEEDKPLEVYTYIYNEREGYTKQRAVIEIIARPKPTDFISQPSDINSDDTQLLEKKLDKFQGLENAGKIMTVNDEGYLTVSAISVDGDKNYIYTQNRAESVWTIQHNLNKFPAISIVDTAGTQVFGEVKYINSSKLTITFSAPFAGKAYLN